jgi:branched-chain amino acid transport system ATP-binding protein
MPSRLQAARPDPPGTSPPVLELRGVDAGYGPFRALFDVSLSVADGGALALLGPNGAGKTTVARVASGLVEASRGKVLLDGCDATRWAAHRFARAGVAHATEGRSVFASLTVEENLLLGSARDDRHHEGEQRMAHAYELFPRLAERRRQLAGTLSGGEQRMLSLARVLALSPRVLIADELSLGLAPVIVSEVYATLRRIRSEGTALLIIEQQVDNALAVADEAVVLDRGEVTYRGPASDSEEINAHLLPHADAGPAR